MKALIVRSGYFSLGVSTVVTAIATEWDWLKNPGGIFHDESGTNWPFVADTAISWFVPTLIYTFALFTIAAIGLRLIRTNIRRYRAKINPRSKGRPPGNRHE